MRALFFVFRVTDHIVATSRPSTEVIEKYNIIDQFKRYTFNISFVYGVIVYTIYNVLFYLVYCSGMGLKH